VKESESHCQLNAAAVERGFVLPEYPLAGEPAPRTLAAVLPAAAAALGVHDDEGTFAAAQTALEVPSISRVCVVLVDGLGFDNLAERSGHAPFLRSLAHDDGVLTCGFPSTTATSLGVFGTGSCPGRTGMLGYSTRNPHTGDVANMVSWAGAPPPRDVQREETVFERLSDAGVRATSVGPARFATSGMTQAALRGARYQNAESLADRVDAVAYELMTPGLAYLYWGDIDKVGHHQGSESWQWGDELESADRELARLPRILPPDTHVIITADHGMVDVDRARQRDVAAVPALAEGVKLVAGEPRASHVYATRRRAASAIADRWRDVLGDDALVATRDEAIDAGWFGPVAPHVLDSIGDVIVAATENVTVVDSRSQSAASIALIGVHGSLTPREMRVPFLTYTT
jgi:Type I phosphodiesterase / nucleotide pyrophosphatase